MANVFDATGRRIAALPLNQGQTGVTLSTGEFAAGLYIVRLAGHSRSLIVVY